MLIKVPMSWLRDYVDVDGPADEIAQLLHMSGTEVDHVERTGGGWDKVWVGRIAALTKHPGADRLTLATVEYGPGRRGTVVTGATNLEVGALVAYGEVGARIHDGHTGEPVTLAPRKVRGVPSEGMVLSERELGIGEDHEGILLLDAAAAVGEPLADALGEAILALELQPNRPDCLGIVGIAREVAALTRQALREPEGAELHFGALAPDRLDVRIDDPDACPRFAAALLEGVEVGPSPRWMQERLASAGMRPIYNVVDITNYVMLELGQPLHAYDAERVRGRTLIARRAAPDERLRTLDGVGRELPARTLVIADAERALGVAGILGGEDSEIRPDTTTVALECASFEPRGIGRTATALGLHGSSGSAAARRFAWELSPALVPIALARAVDLLVQHAGARCAGAVDRYPRPREVAAVRLRGADIGRVLGATIADSDAVDALRRLEFDVALHDGGMTVTPPAVRTDIAIPEDVIEEVARIVGYEHIPTRIPDGPLPLHEAHPFEAFRERARDALVAFGLQETVSYALIDPAWLSRLEAEGCAIAPEPLVVTNPTSVTQSAARPTLRASLLDTLRRNHRQRPSLAIFEIAPAYLPRPHDLPEERWTIAIGLAGDASPPREGETWLIARRAWDIWDLKGVMSGLSDALRLGPFTEPARRGAPGLHPGRSETWTRDGRPAAVYGQLDPRVAEAWDLPASTFVAELDLRSLFALVRQPVVAPPSRYPAASRDLAIVVEETVPYGDVERAIRDAAKSGLESVALVDLYRGLQVGAGRKSVAVRLTFRSESGTLTEQDIERSLRRIEGRLTHTLGATVRS
ncbi:MAG: phenylalanine--tRNA ligase subunit beta [Chloroflexota bacterium]|nr:phenylalanine--tRNA ligase subunit beta [Chloroflexota bacterium]